MSLTSKSCSETLKPRRHNLLNKAETLRVANETYQPLWIGISIVSISSSISSNLVYWNRPDLSKVMLF